VNGAPDRLAREQAKARRRRRVQRGIMPGLLLLSGIALLFALAWGANEKEQLARRQTRLLQQHSYESEELLRLRSVWSRATARDRIVPRAVEELELVDLSEQPKEIVVLREPPAPPPASGPVEVLRSSQWLAKARLKLEGVGRISEAAAKEQRP
jgi:hypothetical protein